jgi:short-subunit dehydrogenase
MNFKKHSLRETALITGASSGIGKAFAFELGKAGFDLILVARRGDLLKKIASEIKQQYAVSIAVISLDLSRLGNLEKLVNKIKEVDLLINDAGMGLFGRFFKI